jgi:hypothetical protein
MRKAIYEANVHVLTEYIWHESHNRILQQVAPELYDVFSDDLKEFLNHSVSHALLHSLSNAVGLSVSYSVPKLVNPTQHEYLTPALHNTLTHTLTLGLTHSLVPTLQQTLKTTVFDHYYCYMCKTYGYVCCDSCIISLYLLFHFRFS